MEIKVNSFLTGDRVVLLTLRDLVDFSVKVVLGFLSLCTGACATAISRKNLICFSKIEERAENGECWKSSAAERRHTKGACVSEQQSCEL